VIERVLIGVDEERRDTVGTEANGRLEVKSQARLEVLGW